VTDKNTNLNSDVLKIDPEVEIGKISESIRSLLSGKLHRRGLVVAISGGVDSAVCAALAVKAVGPKKVFGLLLPEHDSSSSSVTRGKMVVDQLGIDHNLHDIAPTLESIGCYSWRDDAIKSIFPDYDGTWKNKIVIAGGMEGKINHFKLVVEKPDGSVADARLPLQQYLQIVAATNYKQRIRKTIEYFHADRLNYAVVGTPNRLEYDQGFFVKNGDGSADIKPIAHLFKTQVYVLARYLKLPEEICNAAPSTDTYSLQQGQDEFYFALPYQKMDYALWAHNHKVPAQHLAQFLEISESQADWIYKDIESKRRTTAYIHAKAALVDDVKEIL
jgi:NAD+ synthase